MNRKCVCRMLVLGLFLIGLTGCSSKATFGLNWGRVDDTRQGIDELVADPERSAAMHAVVDGYATEAKEIMAEIKADREEIVEKNRNYDTTREELQELYDHIHNKLDQLIALARDRSMEMRQLCSEEEWNEIFEDNDEFMNFEF